MYFFFSREVIHSKLEHEAVAESRWDHFYTEEAIQDFRTIYDSHRP